MYRPCPGEEPGTTIARVFFYVVCIHVGVFVGVYEYFFGFVLFFCLWPRGRHTLHNILLAVIQSVYMGLITPTACIPHLDPLLVYNMCAVCLHAIYSSTPHAGT